MTQKVLLLTPPFTQLNTPYPATMYLKGYLNTLGVDSLQLDLGIDVVLKLLTRVKLQEVFTLVDESDLEVSDNIYRILSLREEYESTIEPVIRFLQGRNATLAYSITERGFLPQSARFDSLDDLEFSFGASGVQDKAKYLATLYLQDIGDFIRETVDPYFGFSRYAERLGHSANSFNELDQELREEPTFTDELLFESIDESTHHFLPDLILISVPFPGNLYAGFRSAQFLKSKFPTAKISMGGGFVNTELRDLTDARVFNYVDFLTLDDGEQPVTCLLEHLNGKRSTADLKRTFLLEDGQVKYKNGAKERDVPFAKVGTPDYTDIDLTKYLSVLEVINPMHRLWSDGRWNKLTMAHGCYWKKCSFCDISLDYIATYEPVTAKIICDRMEEQIETTGETGFHFVDEAAPPALMKEVALEIIRRKLVVTWWANIRFESSFTPDVCKILSMSGCIAVSGGLEVASNRLLELMEKGVSVEQVAQVCKGFTDAGILVHSYLMYGFPTQTDQETIDSLEVVRQLFQSGVVQSGFWHLFAMTAHSPVGLYPERYGVIRTGPEKEGFAYNDLSHEDPEGAMHEMYSTGLKKSLFNYMNRLGFDLTLQEWFDFKVPETSIKPDFISRSIVEKETAYTINKKVVWIGKDLDVQVFQDESGELFSVVSFETKLKTIELEVSQEIGKWMKSVTEENKLMSKKYDSFGSVLDGFEEETGYEKELLEELAEWRVLRENGLLIL